MNSTDRMHELLVQYHHGILRGKCTQPSPELACCRLMTSRSALGKSSTAPLVYWSYRIEDVFVCWWSFEVMGLQLAGWLRRSDSISLVLDLDLFLETGRSVIKAHDPNVLHACIG